MTPREGVQADPRDPLEGPEPPVETRQTAPHPRETCPPRSSSPSPRNCVRFWGPLPRRYHWLPRPTPGKSGLRLPQVAPGYRQSRSPGVVSPSTAFRGGKNPAGREGGRPPTDPRQGAPTPGSRRDHPSLLTGAGSADGQRHHTGTAQGRQPAENFYPALDIGRHSNARGEPRPIAGATQERSNCLDCQGPLCL
jgi:hypothetical protein